MNTTGSEAMREYQQMNLKHEIEEATPHRLIQLMMERVLAKIALAGSHMARNEVSEKGDHIGGAISIISGLQASLNYKADEQLSANFDALYDYMTRRLLEAHLNNDPDILDEVAGLMRELKSAWDAVGETAEAEAHALAAV